MTPERDPSTAASWWGRLKARLPGDGLDRTAWNLARKALSPAAKDALVRTRLRFVRVEHKAAATNVYHCCVHKTASQWVRRILSDPRTYLYCGLLPFNYQAKLPGGGDLRKTSERRFTVPFPKNTVVSPLYITFDNFVRLPKPERYRAFFVMRDPRDLVVSWYHSTRYSHPTNPVVQRRRAQLADLSLTDGILYSIECWEQLGRFHALDSWVEAPEEDPNVKLFRFEELAGENSAGAFGVLFDHCDVRMPAAVLRQVLSDHSFRRMTGRRAGQQDKKSKYRRGVAGDWRNYFGAEIERRFRETTGDLVERLGYRW